MADVGTHIDVHQWVNDYLDYLFMEWEQLPELAAEWDDWDDLSRLPFVLNWGVPADRLAQLHAWAADGLLTPTQRGRYHQLLQLIANNRPTLERLLAE